MAKQMIQCNLLILLLPPNIAVLTSSAFCLITQCYYFRAWKTPVGMTGTYRIISCCGDSHTVSIDQLEIFTHILFLTRARERKRRESQQACPVCSFFFLPRKKEYILPVHLWISHQVTPAPSQHHLSLNSVRFTTSRSFTILTPVHILQLPKPSTFRPIIS